MTENKRYYFDDCFGICDKNKGNSDYTNMLHNNEVVNRLNELNDENKTLKKENEQLKNENKKLKDTVKRLNDNINELLEVDFEEDLLKENKELKSALSELKEIGDYQSIRMRELNDENKELQETLLSVLKQLYSAQRGLVYDYSTDISNDEKELAEYFKEKYTKYGWGE